MPMIALHFNKPFIRWKGIKACIFVPIILSKWPWIGKVPLFLKIHVYTKDKVRRRRTETSHWHLIQCTYTLSALNVSDLFQPFLCHFYLSCYCIKSCCKNGGFTILSCFCGITLFHCLKGLSRVVSMFRLDHFVSTSAKRGPQFWNSFYMCYFSHVSLSSYL